MMWLRIKFILLLIVLFTTSAQADYKVCATSKFATECIQLQRGNSEVHCQHVQDSIECAKRIMNGTADFGKFSAENTAHLAMLGWTDLTIIKELRHRSRRDAPIDFESVAIVRKNHSNGLAGLSGKGFCHPGLYYGKSSRWTEKFLKYFEREVAPVDCDVSTSAAEIETAALNTFFGASCRPGVWSHGRVEDEQLKKKYPKLCQLCDNKTSCSYSSNADNQALNCLLKGNNVAYVSLQDAKYFFGKHNNITKDYSYLCADGTLQVILNNTTPCSWLKESWDVIIANPVKSIDIGKSMDAWLNRESDGSWQSSLFSIITPNSFKISQTTIQSPVDHMRAIGRGAAPKQLCSTESAWCTVSPSEKEKCDVIRAGGISSGVRPLIECLEPAANTIDCIEAISQGRADFMGLDSNYGYLARKLYNLTAALYFETETDQYSSIVTVVHDRSKFRTFESLKGARACIPEFGGTASLAFVNLGKSRGFMARRECRYGLLLSSFFGKSCAPGSTDYKHQRTSNTQDTNTLCDFCKSVEPVEQISRTGYRTNITGTPSLGNDNCAADESNKYYGNDGALRCLDEGGDVAILELQSLSDHARNLNISENEYRVLCRNGSLASHTGFDVDLDCALTTIVDGEIVVRTGTSKMNSIINGLSAVDSYFQVDPDFKMYNIYDNQTHLLFKDSTIGLIGYNEEDLPKRVQNYKKLFEYVESCKQGNSAGSLSGFTSMFLVLTVSAYLAF